MKNRLIEVIKKALESGRDSGELPIAELPDTVLTRPKDEQHGDFTSTVAMVLASRLKMKPLDLAALIEKKIVDTADSDFLEKVEVVPPGFMNFFLSKDSFYEPLREITRTGLDYGRSAMGAGTAVQIEFVSANPVGPLHLGHGRWAAVGDSLARLLVKAGYDVSTEFYVNDYGTQMELFGRSLEAEYLALLGRPAEPPEGAYKGAYIGDLAQVMKDQVGDEVTDLGSGGQWVQFSRKGSALVLEKMADVLKTLGVEFDRWFSETELHRSGAVLEAVKALADAGATYEKDEAVWFRSTDFGDQKDRVLIRRADAGEGGGTGGLPTYFASDVAYHRDKLGRGFSKLINVWGADHHGYVKRVEAGLEALGYPKGTLEVVLGQLVNLYRGGKPVRMSKRTGDMVTLEELVEEVGADSVRFFFLMRSTDSPLDFDIDLAKKRSDENPVFYVQYAHARISSIIRFAEDQGKGLKDSATVDLTLLKADSERALVRRLAAFEDLIETAASKRAPHLLTQYARELATAFHLFYHECRVVGNADQADASGASLDAARLYLVTCVRSVIANACNLLGISAPEKM